MKYIYLLVLLCTYSSLLASNNSFEYYTADKIPANMSVATKKERFYHLLVPAIQKVHQDLMNEFFRIRKNMLQNRATQEIENLKIAYKAKTNQELLEALKPHPQSIVIAQAAMESAWGTSRFFREANNVFGMWSKNPREPRIPAGIKRNGKKRVWLRKFDSIEDSVRAYYRLMARGKHFKKFRRIRYKTDNVHEIVKKLDKYSEIGHFYGEQLSAMIRFNKLKKYDI